MTPEQVLTNIGALLTALMVPAAIVAGLTAVVIYGISKVTDNPYMTRWAKGSGLGAIVLYGGNAAISILQNISTRTFG